ncbi:TRAP transporter small permease [Cellulomonas sp. NS3]|uniref:TRAP transporter small permease n=1 Tax=Cellulomonas sp. NS3 TaxID=2973977 RepID=UPI002163833E|nr:TRAP transporter small permease [Cellulomonas sp. NS3]
MTSTPGTPPSPGAPPPPDEPVRPAPAAGPPSSPYTAVLDTFLRAVCVTLFALLVVLVTWQVLTRLVLSEPSVWTEEAARYVFIWLSLIGISIATGEKADVAIDYFVQKAPLAAQRVLEIVAYLATLSFALLVMVWGGWANAMQNWNQANPVLPVSAGVLYLAVPVAGVLVTFYLLLHLVQTLSPRYAGVQTIAPEDGVEL